MKIIHSTISLALLMLFVGASANAQTSTAGTKVAVINQELTIARSKVGKYVADQLKVLDKTIDEEFEPELVPLRTQAQQLDAEMSALSPETLRTRTDLQRRGQDIRLKLNELRAWKQRQMDATRQQPLSVVLKIYQSEIKAVIDAAGIQVLLPKESTLYHISEVDITQTVVDRMDTVITTTSVNRVRVPRKLTPEQQAAAARGR